MFLHYIVFFVSALSSALGSSSMHYLLIYFDVTKKWCETELPMKNNVLPSIHSGEYVNSESKCNPCNDLIICKLFRLFPG